MHAVARYGVSLVGDACGDFSRERHAAALALYGNYMYRVADTAGALRALGTAADGEGLDVRPFWPGDP